MVLKRRVIFFSRKKHKSNSTVIMHGTDCPRIHEIENSSEILKKNFYYSTNEIEKKDEFFVS